MQYDHSLLHVAVIFVARLTIAIITVSAPVVTGQGSTLRSREASDEVSTYKMDYATDLQQRKHVQGIITALRGLGIIDNGDCFALDRIVRTIRQTGDNGSNVDVHFYLQEHAHGKGRPSAMTDTTAHNVVATNISSGPRVSDVSDTELTCTNGLLIVTQKQQTANGADHLGIPVERSSGKLSYLQL